MSPTEKSPLPIFSHDKYGIYRIVPGDKVESILYGPIDRRVGMITKPGLKWFSTNKDKKRMILGAVEKENYTRIELNKHEETDVNLIDLPEDIKKLFNQSGINVIEKKINKSAGKYKSLFGWETAQALLAIQDVFTKHNFQVITPLGATERSLFLPYLEAENYVNLFDILHWQYLPPARLQFFSQLFQETKALSMDVELVLRKWLSERGFAKHITSPETEMVHQYNDTKRNKSLSLVLDSTCSGESDEERRDVNWLIPKSSAIRVKPLLKSGKASEAYKLIKDTMLCIDPIVLVENA